MRSQVIGRKPFWRMTLTFDPQTPKSIGDRGHLLTMTNRHVKFEGCRPMRSQVIGRKPFWHMTLTVTLTFDPQTPKSIGVIY